MLYVFIICYISYSIKWFVTLVVYSYMLQIFNDVNLDNYIPCYYARRYNMNLETFLNRNVEDIVG